MGPMAGRFHEQFELGPDDESIVSVDADGVAFAAIQGLAGRLAEKADRIDDLEAEVEDLADRQERLHSENDDLRADLAEVEAEKEALRERLAAVEERLRRSIPAPKRRRRRSTDPSAVDLSRFPNASSARRWVTPTRP